MRHKGRKHMAFAGFKGYNLQVNLLLISSIRDKELRDYIYYLILTFSGHSLQDKEHHCQQLAVL